KDADCDHQQARRNMFDRPAAERRRNQPADHERNKILQRGCTQFDEKGGGGGYRYKKFSSVDGSDGRARRVSRANERRGRDGSPTTSATGVEKAGDKSDRSSPDGRRVPWPRDAKCPPQNIDADGDKVREDEGADGGRVDVRQNPGT